MTIRTIGQPEAASRGLSRRSFLSTASAFGLACMAGPTLSQGYGIGPAPQQLPAADGPLRWLDSGDQKAVFFKAFLAEYSQARGIDHIYDGLPWTEIATVVPLGVRNNSAPDAFTLPMGMPPSVAIAEGWVRPLDDLIPDFDAWKAGFPAGSFIEGVNMLGGKTDGLPYTSQRRSTSLQL
ncbi:MAG: sugar ABC transporter substrate-binding protein, partial [Gemmobacter sp.]